VKGWAILRFAFLPALGLRFLCTVGLFGIAFWRNHEITVNLLRG